MLYFTRMMCLQTKNSIRKTINFFTIEEREGEREITLLILHDNHSSFRDMFRDDKEFRDVNHM